MFNEQNTIEQYLVELFQGQGYTYIKAKDLRRKPSDIFLEEDLRKAIYKHNRTFTSTQAQEDLILFELNKICLQAEQIGIVTANEMFSKWLQGEKTMPFGEDGKHVTVNLIDFENPKANSFIVTQQLSLRSRTDVRFDIVLYINGMPLVVGECKSPVRTAISWLDGAQDIQHYEQIVSPFFVPNVLSFATEGRTFRYAAVDNSLEFWGTWRSSDSTLAGLKDIDQVISSLFNKETLLDLTANFTLFATTKKKKKIKIIGRHQQYDAANLMVSQVVKNQEKRALIWHFQGSGKSLLMVFAALKLRKIQALKNPTILIIVDRVDLDTQITATFSASDIPNTTRCNNRDELAKLLKQDTRKIIITTIHKFGEAEGILNDSNNIIALVDEAHRTQEGDLARKMRTALPNASWFGLTGTPINKRDKNTFLNFGNNETLYLSRYSLEDALKDQTTLPLHFEARMLAMQIKKEDLDTAFDELTIDLDDKDKATLSKRAASLKFFLKNPHRIQAIAADIVAHFKAKVSPYKFKAQIVCMDRETCHLYKLALDQILKNEASSAVVMSDNKSDVELRKYALTNDQEEKILEKFKDGDSELQFLIVTNKLLTGFDAPILQVMYLDKVIKDHNLLQAICRTNRLYPNKTHGLIVDYVGIFSHMAKALEFDEKSIQQAVSNIEAIKEQLPTKIDECLAFFPNLDRSIGGSEGIFAAQECLRDIATRDDFAQSYNELARLWEIISPDTLLNQYEPDYVWLSRIYESVRPLNNAGRLLWNIFGAKTKALIDEHVVEGEMQTDFETLVLDVKLMEQIANGMETHKAKDLEIILFARLRKHANDPKFEALSKELEELKDRAEKKLIDSLEFLKKLVEYSHIALDLEKGVVSKDDQKRGKAMLSELFNDAKYKDMPIAIENIVNDIDKGIVKYVNIDGWQYSSKTEQDVKRCLVDALKRYSLHKDIELRDKAYSYIKAYY
jgi:type I restriction enzyme R subunit